MTVGSRLRPLRRVLWAVFILAVPVVLYARLHSPKALPVLGTLPGFTLRDTTNRPFGRRDLQGKVWVADFIFTTCTASCPRLTAYMSRVQSRLVPDGDAVRLVSFSVDPVVDTPEVLGAYARAHGAGPRWVFLTGPLGDIQSVVVHGFHVLMDPPSNSSQRQGFFDIVHGNNLVLVDPAGRIRGYYHADADELDRLVADVHALLPH